MSGYGRAIRSGLRFGRRHWRAFALCAVAAGGLALASWSGPSPARAAATHAATGKSGASLPLPPPLVAPPSSGGKNGLQAKGGQNSEAASNAGNGNTPAPTDTKALVAKALAKTDKRLTELRNALGITEAEKKNWAAFVQVARDHAKALAKMKAKRAKDLAHMNAVQNIESYAAISAKQADDMNALSAAFQILYGKLTKSQQSTADQVFRKRAQEQAGIRLGAN